MGENRRTSPRHPVELVAAIHGSGGSTTARMVNLSVGGAFIAVERKLGDRIQLSFQVPTLPAPISTEAVVRWVEKGGTGVQFDGLGALEVWGLFKYFEQIVA